MAMEDHGKDQDDPCFEHEVVQLPRVPDQNSDERWHSKEGPINEKISFLRELRYNTVTRSNVFLSVFVAFANATMGWSRAQTGTAFLDILFISRTNLEKGSAFMTSYCTGRVVGSILGGVIYSRVNRYLILVVSLSINSVTLSLIPWCALYELMVTVHVIDGICNGVMGVVLTAVAVSIWGATARGRVYLTMSSAFYAASSLLSPIVTSPFLLPLSRTVTMEPSQWNSSSDKIGYYINRNDSNQSFSSSTPHHQSSEINIDLPLSNVYIAYSISAGLVVLANLPFIVIYFKSSKNQKESSNYKEPNFHDKLPLYLKWLQFVNVGIFTIAFLTFDFTFTGYLTVFCVKHLKWKKTSGAMLTSAFFLFALFGRILGSFVSHFLKPLTILAISSFSCTIGLIGLCISGAILADVGIWISVCVIGVPYSLTWASLLSWTDANLIPVRGKVTAYLMISGFVGALLSPLLFGYMMEEISPIWFCYLSLGMIFVNIINVILMFIYSRKLDLQQNDGPNDDSESNDC